MRLYLSPLKRPLRYAMRRVMRRLENLSKETEVISFTTFPKYFEHQPSSLFLLRALGADVPIRLTRFVWLKNCAVMSFAMARL